ncbi:unnamed protein product [Parnassius apollo]|uniref:(apollo) hypothetical protein n=1 Tax=Parnassius apollo TaxID=110799 RepID=A0A8S3XHL3_PARAO|nr:unnamed protein product [Parnassius apollo]
MRVYIKHYFVSIVVWTIFLISNTVCIRVTESEEEDYSTNGKVNTTTLYPVDKITTKPSAETTEENNLTGKQSNTDNITWKINTTFAFPKESSENEEYINEQILNTINKETEDCRNRGEKDKKEFKHNHSTFLKDKNEADLNKVKAVLHEANENAKNVKENEPEKSMSKEFKPSPHLSSYYDTIEDTSLYSFTPPIRKPVSSFIGSPGDYSKPNYYKFPEEYQAFPYKYGDSDHKQRNSNEWSTRGLQSKPTVEAPVKIPAGSLYERPDVLKEKPKSYEDNDDLSLESHDNTKEFPLKKRSNPWKSLLHLLTALLPVGLIVSALAPSVITVENIGPDSQHFKRLSRHLGDSAVIPSVSEACKRRLLCEIHSERNYQVDIQGDIEDDIQDIYNRLVAGISKD